MPDVLETLGTKRRDCGDWAQPSPREGAGSIFSGSGPAIGLKDAAAQQVEFTTPWVRCMCAPETAHLRTCGVHREFHAVRISYVLHTAYAAATARCVNCSSSPTISSCSRRAPPLQSRACALGCVFYPAAAPTGPVNQARPHVISLARLRSLSVRRASSYIGPSGGYHFEVVCLQAIGADTAASDATGASE
jgi:hypothetical protein